MKRVIIALFVLMPIVYAQIPWEISDQRCGDEKLDKYELCEKNVDETKCPQLGTLLKIAIACDEAHCTCVPRVLKTYCGNNRREGVEVCDGKGEDKCGEYGQLINMSLKCNPVTCGCSINETLPSDYNPVVVDTLTNASSKKAVCGDKKVERYEDCDPPNTLCTTNKQEPGICTESCACLTPEQLVAGVPLKNETGNRTVPNMTSNKTSESIGDIELENVTSDVENVTGNITDTKSVPEPGFFASMWAWIVALFS